MNPKTKLLTLIITWGFFYFFLGGFKVQAYNPPIGIPDPGGTWEGGLHPIDTPLPSQPTGWPSQEVEHYYYIDNSDANCTNSNNQYGYPEKPRCSFTNGTYPAGTYVEFHGNPTNTMQTTFECTETQPCWIVGRPNDRPVFKQGGRIILTDSKYVFIDGLNFTDKTSNAIAIDNNTNGIGNHISVRNNLFYNFGLIDHAGAVVAVVAGHGGALEDIVVYNNEFWGIGDPDPIYNPNNLNDTDFHATEFGLRGGDEHTTQAHRLFWLENNVHDCGGSGIQVNGTHPVMAERDHLSHCYIGKNTGYHNRQRLIGVKVSTDVVVSQNDYLPWRDCGSAGCVSESLGWANSPDYVWFLFNNMHDGSQGIRASQILYNSADSFHDTTHVYILGNVIHNLDIDFDPLSGNYSPADDWRDGQAIFEKNSAATVYSENNTMYNVYTGIEAHKPKLHTHARGNIIWKKDNNAPYLGLEGAKQCAEKDTQYIDQPGEQLWDTDYNVFYSLSGDNQWRYLIATGTGNNDYTSYHDIQTLSDYRSYTGDDDINSVVADPKLFNPSKRDYHLTGNSPMVAGDAHDKSVYDLFQSRYGIDIKKDFDGNSRPTGNWSVGAYQYDANAVCDATHKYLCNSGNCAGAGGFWDGSYCADEHVVCSPKYLYACDQQACSDLGFFWTSRGKCSPIPERQCSENYPTYCGSSTECSNVSGIWENGHCKAGGNCEAGNIAACTDQVACESVGGIWDVNYCVQVIFENLTCDAAHTSLCTTESSCQVIGGSWDSFSCLANTTGPIRLAGSPTGQQLSGTTQVTMSLTTDESATCRYSTTAGTAYASMTDTFSTTGSTNHSQLITGLTDGQSYTYYVRCSGTEVNDTDYTISWSVSSPDTCDASHLNLCNNSTSCQGAGGNWCSGVCQANSCSTGIRADVDQNSTINSTDAMLTLRNSLGLDMSGTNWVTGTHTGDVNCDDSSNSTDAMLILRKSLGLDMSGTGWCGN